MSTILEDAFESSDLGVCIKNSEGKVLQQNTLCLDICGNCFGKVCNDACMELYSNDVSQQWKSWGSRSYKNSFVHGAYFDITLLCGDINLITFLQPLEKKHETAHEYYSKMGLTKREVEIISCIIKGLSNTDICSYLSISKSTIKTHLNHIYKKAREQGLDIKYIPENRLTSFSLKLEAN